MGDSTAIALPYLLVIQIPVIVDPSGRLWTDPLWRKDLLLHLDYLEDFRLACPVAPGPPPADFVPLDDERLRLIPLPRRGGKLRNLRALPGTFQALWKATKHVVLVQHHVIPLDLGLLAYFAAVLRGCRRYVNVESATWRIPAGASASARKRIAAHVAEAISRALTRSAALATFTQTEYRASLLGDRELQGHVIHASWINEEYILPEQDAHASWHEKRKTPVRVLFAARLTIEKGVRYLAAALRALAATDVDLTLDIIGDGPLADECRALATDLGHGRLRVNFLAPVEYGAPFLSLLRGYHAVIVPSIGDEQPRLVYDAYAQAVPVLASSTAGLRDCVIENRTGRFCPPADSSGLAELLAWAAAHPDELERMGLTGLMHAHSLTHQKMHAKRATLLHELLTSRAAGGSTRSEARTSGQ